MSCFGEFGPDRQQRNSLATEEEFVQAIGDVRSLLADDSRDDSAKGLRSTTDLTIL
jgi:hypothetical protein